MRIKKILFISLISVLSLISIFYYTVIATDRECGWSPLKVFYATTNELWCTCSTNITNLNESNLYYGGFSCMNCERLCEKYNLGTEIPVRNWTR